MAEFKPIETQEQLDAILSDRLKREREKNSSATAELASKLEALEADKTALSKKIEEYETKYTGIDEKLAEMTKTIKTYETDSVKTRIAREVGIPWEMRDRLRGENEEEIKADAQALMKLMPKSAPPQKSTETVPSKETGTDAALRKMAQNMNL